MLECIDPQYAHKLIRTQIEWLIHIPQSVPASDKTSHLSKCGLSAQRGFVFVGERVCPSKVEGWRIFMRLTLIGHLKITTNQNVVADALRTRSRQFAQQYAERLGRERSRCEILRCFVEILTYAIICLPTNVLDAWKTIWAVEYRRLPERQDGILAKSGRFFGRFAQSEIVFVGK